MQLVAKVANEADRIVMFGLEAEGGPAAEDAANRRAEQLFANDPKISDVDIIVAPAVHGHEHWGEDDKGNPDLHPGLRADCPHPLCQSDEEGP